LRILIVDDDDDIIILLSTTLNKWGHDVVSASNGLEAWDILRKDETVNFVISDWIMPIMDGADLCRRIRTESLGRYIYIILLTAKEDTNDLVEGMESGADDFVVKPFDKAELQVRIRAGERVLQLEQNLEERNRNLSLAYSIIRKDLETAANMQKSLLPNASMTIENLAFESFFCPSSIVAGDTFNYFQLDANHVCFYMLDVAGHGVSAAMLSVSLNKLLTPSNQVSQPLTYVLPDPQHYGITQPAVVIRELNKRFEIAQDAMQYFTMIYGICETGSNELSLSQAGHPSPVFVERGGKAAFIGNGGYPVGMISNADYDEKRIDFKRGDRLFIYSDGVTECMNADGRAFSSEEIIRLFKTSSDLPLKEILSRLKLALENWKGSIDYTDDVTVLAIERI
jgi:sigma-B regulation protein RsbU (phosphoserine phosphatase)